MASILFLRHGQIAANAKGRWNGSTDSELTWRGRRQARRTAKHLAAREPQITAIYSSPLRRTRVTAEAVSKLLGLPVTIADGLREYAIGEWEDLPFRHLAREHDFVNTTIRDPDFAPPGGESLRDVADRVVPAILEIHQRHREDSKVLVVGHGAAMAVAFGAILERNPARWTNYHFANCSLSELVISPSPYVNFFNSTQHL
jgi:broad specificity phosphatase PhoE